MKNIISKLLVLSLIVFGTSCSNTIEDVNIESLYKLGEQFYFGEKVVVWAGTKTTNITDKNLSDVKYSWSCDGGSFYGPQYLFENLWIAPNTPGIYTVTVTAKVGNKVSTRSTKMKVNYFFYENFDNNLNWAGWGTSGTTISYSLLTNTTYPNKAKCIGTTTGPGYFYKLFTNNLTIPFSVFSNAGFETFIPTGTSNYMRYSLFCATPADLATPFIREIRWEFRPKNTGTNTNFKISFETYQQDAAKSVFNDIVVDTVSPYGIVDNAKLEDYSLSIDADTILHAYRTIGKTATDSPAPTEVCNSDAIRTWLRAHKTENLNCNQIRWTYCGKTTFWFDDFYVVNDGSILLTKPE